MINFQAAKNSIGFQQFDLSGDSPDFGAAAGLVNIATPFSQASENSFRPDQLASTGLAIDAEQASTKYIQDAKERVAKYTNEKTIEAYDDYYDQLKDNAQSAANKSIAGSVGGLAGTGIGFAVGGPVGGAIGGGLGKAIGGLFG